jgi:hypothetical protein
VAETCCTSVETDVLKVALKTVILSVKSIIVFTAIGCLPGGSRPYIDTDKQEYFKTIAVASFRSEKTDYLRAICSSTPIFWKMGL